MNARALLVAAALVLPAPAFAQGFAGLGGGGEGHALPDRATRLAFPDDHGAHPGFRVEWWYVTANLSGEDGAEYGIQWTLFRNALAPGGAPADQAWMGHAAISAPDGHLFAERFARGDLGQAGVATAPFEAHIDEWRMAGPDLSHVSLTAQGTDFAYDLELRTNLPFVPQGAAGYSVKSAAGLASHYYSQPFYRAKGVLHLPGGPVAVEGEAWLDREWSSQPLSPDQTGWDWIALHLEGGAALMGYRIRSTAAAPYLTGTWIAPDGTPTPLADGALEMVPEGETRVAGRRLPLAWRVRLPDRGVDLSVEAIRPESWMGTMIPYWEGPVRATGSHTGRGYLELSGY